MSKKKSPGLAGGASGIVGAGEAGDGASRRDEQAEADRQAIAALDALVPEWLAVPDAADLQGVPLAAVRRQLRDRELLAVRRGANRALSIPAAFVTPDGPRPEMKGTFTVLADGGMSDLELLTWLFTPDTSFLGGSAMGSILAGHKTEVRRRAMEEAF